MYVGDLSVRFLHDVQFGHVFGMLQKLIVCYS